MQVWEMLLLRTLLSLQIIVWRHLRGLKSLSLKLSIPHELTLFFATSSLLIITSNISGNSLLHVHVHQWLKRRKKNLSVDAITKQVTVHSSCICFLSIDFSVFCKDREHHLFLDKANSTDKALVLGQAAGLSVAEIKS